MVAEATGGKLTGGDRVFASVSTDTRTLLPGQLFFAIKGERSDGNAFVAEAARRGAVGAVVTSLQAAELPQVEVADTRIALGRLARAWRRRFTLPVIGVTGSNGKTTVKEIIAAIMRETFGGDASRVLMTWGNLNNEIGLPITLMYLTATHGAAVLELGASKPGDIAYLADIAAPTVSVLTNAFPAHLKGFGNLEQVAATKGEIFAALAPSGVAVVNRDDQYYEAWWKRAEGSRRVSFGLHPAADFRAEDIRSKTGPDGPSLEFELVADGNRATVVLPMAGRHNVVNALAAAAAARSAGATHAAIISGANLYDDSYNANPGSVRAAVEFLAAQPGERWLVLGDMAELGAESDKAHREIGQFVRSLAISRLLCTGASSQHTATGFGPGAEWRSTREELIELLGRPGPGVNILVKGSRSARMEKVVEALAGLTSPATGAH
jgi:UDP-N-acetylmuramoyl-tripeptide--D-alanyl-D-alanine ligase